MKKYSKIISVALSLGIVTSIINQALADSPYEKNKMPCLEGICVGDDIKTLQNIPWMSVDKLLGSKQYKGWKVVGDAKSLQKLLPYLSGIVIDKKGISLLSQVKGFCARPYRNPIFSGEYKGKDGRSVEVSFGLITSPDHKSQKIVVSGITKRLSTTQLSASQIEALQAEVQSRYPNSNKALSQTSAVVRNTLRQDGGVFSSIFYSAGLDDLYESSSLLEFPGCTKKVDL